MKRTGSTDMPLCISGTQEGCRDHISDIGMHAFNLGSTGFPYSITDFKYRDWTEFERGKC